MKKKWILTGAALVLAMALTGCRDNIATTMQKQISQEQGPDQKQMISMEEAQEAALKAANIGTEAADISTTTLSEVAGVSCYKVKFTSGELAYAYTINAETGSVMEMSRHEKDAPDSQPQAEGTDSAVSAPAPKQAEGTDSALSTLATKKTVTDTGIINEAAAQNIALKHAGVNAADATITKSRLEYEDRRRVYEIEWYAGGTKYDYEIAADTGEVISSGYEEKTAGATNRNNITVREADAKKTVLSRVTGATEKDIYEWKLDYDDGRPEYEGKIIYNGMEYDFTIDATNGSVTEWAAETIR